MPDTVTAASFAIQITRVRGLPEVGADELLLGCLQELSRFGIARFGPWTIDLEEFGVEWLQSGSSGPIAKVAYSDAAVAIFDRAAAIARLDGATAIRVEHLLVAYADEKTGLMGELRLRFDIGSAPWRAAAAALPRESPEQRMPDTQPSQAAREYLTPEDAAEALGLHVQTLRAYVRSGKLPAFRVAGERALRIRRSDLNKVLEPLVPDKQ